MDNLLIFVVSCVRMATNFKIDSDLRKPAMASTYLSLHFHIIFATKNRQPTIDAEWRSRLHEYLGGTMKGMGAHSEGVGGVADHVHLMVSLKSTHCLAVWLTLCAS